MNLEVKPNEIDALEHPRSPLYLSQKRRSQPPATY